LFFAVTLLLHGHEHPPVYLVESPGLLLVAFKLDLAGVDLDTTRGAEQILRKRVAQAADELDEYFYEHDGHGFGRKDKPQELESALKAIRALGIEATRIVLAQEVERAVRDRFERGGPAPRRHRR
jgi:hypothetical protein